LTLCAEIFKFVAQLQIFYLMGKGDMKTKRGKICRGTYGKLRPRHKRAAKAK